MFDSLQISNEYEEVGPMHIGPSIPHPSSPLEYALTPLVPQQADVTAALTFLAENDYYGFMDIFFSLDNLESNITTSQVRVLRIASYLSSCPTVLHVVEVPTHGGRLHHFRSRDSLSKVCLTRTYINESTSLSHPPSHDLLHDCVKVVEGEQ